MNKDLAVSLVKHKLKT